jgi:hypothetical protein
VEVEVAGEGRFVIPPGRDEEVREVFRSLERNPSGSVILPNSSESPPETRSLRPFRVAIYRPWQASMDEGWLRWILEHYEFPVTELRNDRVQWGSLRQDFDAIVIPSVNARAILSGNREGSVPPEYAGGIGQEGLEALKAFAREGGTLFFHEGSVGLALQEFGLPLREVSREAQEAGFYSAGSILSFSWAPQFELTRGMDPNGVAFMTSRAGLFEVTGPGTGEVGTPTVLGAFPAEGPLLLSGYLEGEEGLFGRAGVMGVPFGEGRLILVGFSLHNRAQTVANFKLLFNSLIPVEGG